MKILKYSLVAAAVLIVTAALFASCMRGGTLDGITITPATTTIARGMTQQFAAKAHFSDGATLTWTTAVEWNVDNTIDATINTVGDLVTNGIGTNSTVTTVTVSARDVANNIIGYATVNIVDPYSMTVEQASPEVPYLYSPLNNETKQFKATAILSAGTPTITQDISSIVSWETDTIASADVATISATGLITAGTNTGNVIITASDKSSSPVKATYTLLVTKVQLESITLTPATTDAVISIGTTTQLSFSAQGTFPGGIIKTPALTSAWTWTSSNPNVAMIDHTGLASIFSIGTTTIAAADPISSQTGTTILTVNP